MAVDDVANLRRLREILGDRRQELLSQRRKPDVGQFRLQVDWQTKASFATYEEAEAAGMVIKKGHPVVRVSVYDTVEV